MQKVIIVCLALIALVYTAPAEPTDKAPVSIVRSTHDHEFDGSYKFGFETSDGSSRDEAGTVVNAGQDNEYVGVVGSYKYTDPETNEVYEVTYTADEHGFVPVGKHIPEIISKTAQEARNIIDESEKAKTSS